MKKTTVITLAMIITMALSTTYAQKTAVPSQFTNQCPILKGIRTTTTDDRKTIALVYARKTQDIELEDSLMAINTSDTIHTLFVFKYMLTEMKNKYEEMILNGYTLDEVRSVYKTCDYIKAVLNDYLDDMQNKNNDIAFYQKEDRIEFIYDLLIEVKTVGGIYDIIHRFRRAAF